MNNTPKRSGVVLACALVAVSAVFAGLGRGAWGADDKQVGDAIERLRRDLYSNQGNDGSFERLTSDMGQFERGHQGQSGGTALAVYALLASGESPQRPELNRGIKFLQTALKFADEFSV